ncbi:MAG: hypothetical protein J1E95_02830 [Muribaculaceae bacterium]|nr:hypothetical protein [Muribaculaceae bacterium]
MSPFPSFWNHYLCWRHSKGYGVHSPFAFRMVNDVISPGPYGYYGYKEIDRLCSKGSFKPDRMKFLLRLLLFLKSGRLLVFRNLNEELRMVAKLASVKALQIKTSLFTDFKTEDLLVFPGEETDLDLARSAVDSGVSVMAFHPCEELRQLMSKPIPNGLLLYSKKNILLIPRRDMAYTSYPITFNLS